jgi:hypothetical protein
VEVDLDQIVMETGARAEDAVVDLGASTLLLDVVLTQIEDRTVDRFGDGGFLVFVDVGL